MADHDFFGTVSSTDPAAAAEELMRKGEVDSALAGKAAASHTHSTAQVTGLDTALSGKAAASHTHATSEVTGLDTALSGKAASTHTHATSEVTGLDTALAGKAATGHTHTAANITDLQTTVDARISSVLDIVNAPATLDTLNELAAALGDDPNFAATIAGQIGGLDTRLDTLEATAGVGAFKQNIGDGAAKLFTVTHNRGTLDVVVEVVRVSDGQTVHPVVKRPTANTVTVDFGSTHVPSAAQYRVIVDAK